VAHRWPAAARALRHRNFRLFYAGQSLSLVGTWMQRVAVGWLVYRLTDSPLLLGVVSFAGQIPSFLLAPVAGALADRWDRHRMLVATQALAMAQAFGLAALVLSERVEVWQVIALSVVLGVVNGFDMPVRQSYMIEMLDDKADLGNAIALNSTMVNGSRMLGPAIAGLLVAAVGEGVCFLANGVSYVAVIGSLLAMRRVPRPAAGPSAPVWAGIAEAYRYVRDFEPMRALLLLVGLFSLAGMPYTVLMPVVARDILGGGPATLGFLMSAAGLGAFLGAVILASRRSVAGLGRGIAVASLVFSGALVALGWSRVLAVSLPLMALVGVGQMAVFAGSNTLLQSLVDDDKRGRVMSFYTMAFMGCGPLGYLAAGWLAGRLGAPWTFTVCGAVFAAGAIVFGRRLPVLRAKAHPVLLERGLLP
jgi:MFS family permease